jgi:hypothetical protein
MDVKVVGMTLGKQHWQNGLLALAFVDLSIGGLRLYGLTLLKNAEGALLLLPPGAAHMGKQAFKLADPELREAALRAAVSAYRAVGEAEASEASAA